MGLLAGAVGLAVLARPPLPPVGPATEARAAGAPDAPGAPVDVKALVADFKAAFKAKDAAAIAKLWTADAELVTTAGDTVRGRKDIEAAYAALFKSKPDLAAEVESGAVRALGGTAAVVEGVLKLSAAEHAEPDVTVFRAVVVKEADGWRLASVECWEADPEPAALADLEWLVGEWTGTGEDGAELKDITQQLVLVRREQPADEK